MATAFLPTPVGLASIEGDASGIYKIAISDKEEAPSPNVPPELEEAVQQLREYFEGRRSEFELKLNPQGTDFQKRVWQQLANIPFGTTVSYLEMSKELGDVKAIRAVASANGKNPLWVVLPCHRVIGSDGSLTGYAGGLWRKKWLLEHEGAGQLQFSLDF